MPCCYGHWLWYLVLWYLVNSAGLFEQDISIVWSTVMHLALSLNGVKEMDMGEILQFLFIHFQLKPSQSFPLWSSYKQLVSNLPIICKKLVTCIPNNNTSFFQFSEHFIRRPATFDVSTLTHGRVFLSCISRRNSK